MVARQFRWFSMISLAAIAIAALATCSGPAAPSATPAPTTAPTPAPAATANGPTPTPIAALPSPTAAQIAPTAPTATTVAQQATDPTSAIRFAYTATTGVQSFRFSATGSATFAGKSAGDLTFTTTGEQALPDRMHATTSIGGAHSTLSIDAVETTKIGKDVYIHLPASLAPDGKDQWVLLDSIGSIFQGAVGANSAQQNPLDAIALLKDLQNVQTVGDETVNGAATTHYRGAAPPPKGGPSNPVSDFINGLLSRLESTTTTVDVWVGKGDNLVRRISVANSTRLDAGAITRQSTPAPSGAATSPVSAQTALIFDFTDFDTPVTIAPPAKFTKVSDLIGTLDPGKLFTPDRRPQI
jgi:hypothetical protein